MTATAMTGFESLRVSVRRVQIDRHGYDRNGAYWGLGLPIYWYSNERSTIEGFMRASSRDVAKVTILKTNPSVTFTA